MGKESVIVDMIGYDELNRLIHATGKAKSATYDMAMTFNSMSMPLTKVQTVDSTSTAQSYDFTYKYEDEAHPTAPTQIGHDHYTYDANGNPIRVENDSTYETRELYWDEDNRLMVLSDNGKTSRYTYNHAGERIVKSHGDMEGVYINGAPQGITFHETDEYTLYPASIISVNKNRFTKHYFIGDKRVASRIGTGKFNNVYGRNGSYVTAGQQDYAERMNQIESQKEDYYKELGIAPGVPTMKGAYGDPENTGVGYNTIITELGDHSVPEAWAQYAKKNDKEDSAPGAPIAWDDPVSPEEPAAGYGFVADDSAEPEETFYYHSDHLGSTSYITDDKGNIIQYDAYLPYGELLVDEHTSSEEMPYKFNGKEFDEETGLYYYGARYMQPIASVWYGVDPLTEKYPNVSAYTYCMGNPVKMVDVDGKETHVALNKDGTYTVVGGILNKDRGIYVYSCDKNGKYTIRGEKIGLTTSTTSFYNSDKGKWAVNSKINPNDEAGKNFLNKIAGLNVTLDDYMDKARTNHQYDFKVTNGEPYPIKDIDIYRGMPIGGKAFDGSILYTSARDIGNIAAGIVAAKNGIPWADARIAFDAYQVKNNIDRNGYSLDQIQKESLSTRNAEYYGWSQIYKNSNTMTEFQHLKNTIKSTIKRIF